MALTIDVYIDKSGTGISFDDNEMESSLGMFFVNCLVQFFKLYYFEGICCKARHFF